MIEAWKDVIRFISRVLQCSRCTVSMQLLRGMSNHRPRESHGPLSILLMEQAPLTLTGQRGRCRNIKGEPHIYGSFPNPSCTEFKVPSFSHCVNIEVEPQNFEELP